MSVLKLAEGIPHTVNCTAILATAAGELKL